MKNQKIIKSPHAFQLLADETRMRVVYLLRAKEMTVSQIASELGLTPQTIYHHIKKLREAEMVEVAREERIDHLIEYYYRATAGVFHFVDGVCPEERRSPKRIRNLLKALRPLGFDANHSSKQISAIVKLKEDLRRQRDSPDILDEIYEMDEFDSSTERDLIEFALMMRMNDREFEKYIENQRMLRELLLSRRPDKGKA